MKNWKNQEEELSRKVKLDIFFPLQAQQK